MWRRAAQATNFSTLRVHVRPARSIFSKALNFCRLRFPGGPPLPFAPPCNRQRPFDVAGDPAGFPLLVPVPPPGRLKLRGLLFMRAAPPSVAISIALLHLRTLM